MKKIEAIKVIISDVNDYGLKLPEVLQGNKLENHLNKFDVNSLNDIAGFDNILLEHFLNIPSGKELLEIGEVLVKLKNFAVIIGPLGKFNNLGKDLTRDFLSKIHGFNALDITEDKIYSLYKNHLDTAKARWEFTPFAQSLEGEMQNATRFLQDMGYSNPEIKQKMDEVRNDPSKLGDIFSVPPKFIDVGSPVPPELLFMQPDGTNQGMPSSTPPPTARLNPSSTTLPTNLNVPSPPSPSPSSLPSHNIPLPISESNVGQDIPDKQKPSTLPTTNKEEKDINKAINKLIKQVKGSHPPERKTSKNRKLNETNKEFSKKKIT